MSTRSARQPSVFPEIFVNPSKMAISGKVVIAITYLNTVRVPSKAKSRKPLSFAREATHASKNAPVRRFACKTALFSQNGPGAGFEPKSPQLDRYFGSNPQLID